MSPFVQTVVDIAFDLLRKNSGKIVLAVFFLIGPYVGSRVEVLKQPTADLVALYVNTLMPHETQIGAVPLADGGVVLTQETVADKANGE